MSLLPSISTEINSKVVNDQYICVFILLPLIVTFTS